MIRLPSEKGCSPMTSLSEAASSDGTAPLPQPSSPPTDSRLPPADRSALSFGQRRLWVVSQQDGASAAYNESMAFRLRGPLDRTVLGRALDALAARHEALRTRLVPFEGDAYQPVDPAD